VSTLYLALGAVLLAVAVVVAVLYAWSPASAALQQYWKRYEKWADGELRSIFSPLRARQLATRQVVLGLVGGAAGYLALDSLPLALALTGVVGYLPILQLQRDKAQRKTRLEAQLDSTLQSLANTILVTQNLEDAFDTIARQFDPPIAQEADVLVKQVRLGTPMDEALRDLANRTRSRNIDALVTALTIGRQTGGDLPKVLESTAQVLRETSRVEGMMAAKTSEGKTQGIVMGALPFLFGAALEVIDPEWMKPLFHDPVGWAVLALACVLEGVGVAAIRKLSRIDV
jgi:tight adherence protein B